MNTQRAYDSDWRSFTRWLPVKDKEEVTPQMICDYMEDRYPQLAVASLARHLAAIRWQFHRDGMASPTDHPLVLTKKEELQRRDRWRDPQLSNTIDYAMMIEIINKVMEYPNESKCIRDRALLVVGWWSQLERQPLSRLQAGDVTLYNGARVKIWQRHGRLAGPTVVPRDGQLDIWDALNAWKAYAEITEGPLWYAVDRWGNIKDHVIADESVSLIVKDAVSAAGINPSGYSAKSLRFHD